MITSSPENRRPSLNVSRSQSIKGVSKSRGRVAAGQYGYNPLEDPLFKPKRFRARPYRPPQPFIAMKSTKQLTVPVESELKTLWRSRENSRDKSRQRAPSFEH